MIMMMIMIILRLLLIIMIIIIKWWIFPVLFVSSPEGISHYNIPLNHYKIHSLYPINIPFSIVGWLVHHVGYIYIYIYNDNDDDNDNTTTTTNNNDNNHKMVDLSIAFC